MRRFFDIVRDELGNIVHNGGVMLIFIGALVAYSALYGLIYHPEVVEKIPMAVVDMDGTPASRKITRMLNSTSVAQVAYTPSSLESGKNLFMDRKVWGVLYIPEGFERNSLSQTQNHVSLYADGSYFMLYSSFMGSVSEVVMAAGAEIQMETLVAAGIEPAQAEVISQPIKYKIDNLFNPYSGYATSLLPAVIVVILQQTLLIGIGLLLGRYNEFGMWAKYKDSSALTLTFGKALAYIIFYIPLIFYVFWIDYKMFGYPMKENTLELILFIIPYILSVVFLGITLGSLFQKPESSLLYISCLSMFFIMISGITWAKEGMPIWLYGMGHLLPSTNGIDGIVRLRTTGASLSDVAGQWIILWILSFVYAVTAVLALARARIRNPHELLEADNGHSEFKVTVNPETEEI